MMRSSILPLLILFSYAFAIVSLPNGRVIDYSPAHVTVVVSEETTSNGRAVTHSEIFRTRDIENGKRFHDPHVKVEGGPFDPVPRFAGSIKNGSSLSFVGSCFKKNIATISLGTTGFTLKLNIDQPTSFWCQEYLIFATNHRYFFHLFLKRGTHTITVNNWRPLEEADVLMNGVRTFTVMNGSNIIKTLTELYEFYEDFIAQGPKTEKEMIRVHKEYFDYTFRPRSEGVLDIPMEAIESGDVFELHVLSNEELAYWFVAGGHAGHAAMALWHNGVLYIAETTDAEWLGPPYGYHMTPYKEWVKLYNEQKYEISWLKLRPDLAKKFDAEKAYKFFSTHIMPFKCPSYGYVAIDTPRDNVSPPLSPETVILLLSLLEGVNHDLIQFYMYDALNMRFRQYYGVESTCTTIQCLVDHSTALNQTVFDLMALPEIDGWIYKDGPSIVCAGLVAHMMREAGIFGDIEFSAGEIHPRDLYTLKIFDDKWPNKPSVCAKNVPYCQITGRYWMDLPGFNTVPPHDHMRERCGGIAPYYEMDPDC